MSNWNVEFAIGEHKATLIDVANDGAEKWAIEGPSGREEIQVPMTRSEAFALVRVADKRWRNDNR